MDLPTVAKTGGGVKRTLHIATSIDHPLTLDVTIIDEGGRWLNGLLFLLEGFIVELENLPVEARTHAFNWLGARLHQGNYPNDLTSWMSRVRLLEQAIAIGKNDGQ